MKQQDSLQNVDKMPEYKSIMMNNQESKQNFIDIMMMKNVQFVDMQSNSIKSFVELPTFNQCLLYLNLANNNIVNINYQVFFQNLTNLVILDLSNNDVNLQQFKQNDKTFNMMSKMKNLTILNLTNKQIENYDIILFKILICLPKLQVFNNTIILQIQKYLAKQHKLILQEDQLTEKLKNLKQNFILNTQFLKYNQVPSFRIVQDTGKNIISLSHYIKQIVTQQSHYDFILIIQKYFRRAISIKLLTRLKSQHIVNKDVIHIQQFTRQFNQMKCCQKLYKQQKVQIYKVQKLIKNQLKIHIKLKQQFDYRKQQISLHQSQIAIASFFKRLLRYKYQLNSQILENENYLQLAYSISFTVNPLTCLNNLCQLIWLQIKASITKNINYGNTEYSENQLIIEPSNIRYMSLTKYPSFIKQKYFSQKYLKNVCNGSAPIVFKCVIQNKEMTALFMYVLQKFQSLDFSNKQLLNYGKTIYNEYLYKYEQLVLQDVFQIQYCPPNIQEKQKQQQKFLLTDINTVILTQAASVIQNLYNSTKKKQQRIKDQFKTFELSDFSKIQKKLSIKYYIQLTKKIIFIQSTIRRKKALQIVMMYIKCRDIFASTFQHNMFLMSEQNIEKLKNYQLLMNKHTQQYHVNLTAPVKQQFGYNLLYLRQENNKQCNNKQIYNDFYFPNANEKFRQLVPFPQPYSQIFDTLSDQILAEKDVRNQGYSLASSQQFSSPLNNKILQQQCNQFYNSQLFEFLALDVSTQLKNNDTVDYVKSVVSVLSNNSEKRHTRLNELVDKLKFEINYENINYTQLQINILSNLQFSDVDLQAFPKVFRKIIQKQQNLQEYKFVKLNDNQQQIDLALKALLLDMIFSPKQLFEVPLQNKYRNNTVDIILSQHAITLSINSINYQAATIIIQKYIKFKQFRDKQKNLDDNKQTKLFQKINTLTTKNETQTISETTNELLTSCQNEKSTIQILHYIQNEQNSKISNTTDQQNNIHTQKNALQVKQCTLPSINKIQQNIQQQQFAKAETIKTKILVQTAVKENKFKTKQKNQLIKKGINEGNTMQNNQPDIMNTNTFNLQNSYNFETQLYTVPKHVDNLQYSPKINVSKNNTTIRNRDDPNIPNSRLYEKFNVQGYMAQRYLHTYSSKLERRISQSVAMSKSYRNSDIETSINFDMSNSEKQQSILSQSLNSSTFLKNNQNKQLCKEIQKSVDYLSQYKEKQFQSQILAENNREQMKRLRLLQSQKKYH